MRLLPFLTTATATKTDRTMESSMLVQSDSDADAGAGAGYYDTTSTIRTSENRAAEPHMDGESTTPESSGAMSSSSSSSSSSRGSHGLHGSHGLQGLHGSHGSPKTQYRYKYLFRKALFLFVASSLVLISRRGGVLSRGRRHQGPAAFRKTLRYASASKQIDERSTRDESQCPMLPITQIVPTAPAPPGWPNQVCTIQIQSTVDGTMQPSLHYSPPSTMLVLPVLPVQPVQPIPHLTSSDPEEPIGQAKAQEQTKTEADSNTKRPLLVALHTWSSTYRQANGGETIYAQWAMEHDWHFLHPDFRGPNRNPEACGSESAVQDVIDVVDFMVQHYAVDTDRIYVVGVSGGGYMAALLAGRHPGRWAGVSAWAPITDLTAWWDQRHGFGWSIRHISGRRYATHIEQVVGGPPDVDHPDALAESQHRSPVQSLSQRQRQQHQQPLSTFGTTVNLDLNAGIHDGRSGGSVPFSHALYGFDAAVGGSNSNSKNETIGTAAIERFYTKRTPPEDYQGSSHDDGDGDGDDPLYSNRRIYYRKIVDTTRVTIFEGGHEILHLAALNWLQRQAKGVPADWTRFEPDEIDPIQSYSSQDSQAGK